MNEKTEKLLRDDLRQLEANNASAELFQLAQARKSALTQSRPDKKRLIWPTLATSMATALLLVVIAMIFNPTEQSLPSSAMTMTDIQIDEPLVELYEELDFYHWLSESQT
jgi:hypothetical protein